MPKDCAGIPDPAGAHVVASGTVIVDGTVVVEGNPSGRETLPDPQSLQPVDPGIIMGADGYEYAGEGI